MMNQQQGRNQSTNALLVPQSEMLMEQMKYEIAQEMGVTLGADTSARDNGRVGGEMTRRMVRMAQQMMANEQNQFGNTPNNHLH